MKAKINESQLKRIVSESVKRILREDDRADAELFMQVFENFRARYHDRLDMRGSLVYVDGQVKFNTDGYNLLYNLKRLCEALEDELL